MSVLGIDIGGTEVKVGICDDQGQFLYKARHSTSEWRREGFIAALCDCVAKLLAAHPGLRGAAFGIPAPMNRDCTVARETTAVPELGHYPLAAELRRRFPALPIVLEKDTHLAALGEGRFNPALQGDFVFITLGTGVGAAAVIDKRLFYGGGGGSMQLGHVVFPDGRTLEQKIGVAGVQSLMQGRFADFAQLIRAGEASDPVALGIFGSIGADLAVGITNAVVLLDVATVVIGGGLSAAFHLFESDVTARVRARVIPYFGDRLRLQKAILGNDAGMLGAVVAFDP